MNPGSGGDIVASDDIAGVKYQRVKVTLGSDGVNDEDVSSSNPMPISVSGLPLPTGASTEATTLELLGAISYLLSAILEKLPRVNGNDQAAISIEAGSVGLASGQTLATVTNLTTVATLSNITNIGARPAATIPDAISQLGALHLYQNIIVS